MGSSDRVSSTDAHSGKGDGYLSADIVSCQLSLYPLRQQDVGPAVRGGIGAARAEGCTVRVGNLSTLLWGSEEQVFAGARAAFRAAQAQGSAVMTATFVAGMPSDELVAEIQDGVDG